MSGVFKLRLFYFALALATALIANAVFGWPAWAVVSSPFVGLALLPLPPKEESNDPFWPFAGAGLGVFVALVIPGTWTVYLALNSWPGGANIGLGLLLLATPVTAIILGMIGFGIGLRWSSRSDTA